MGRKMVLNSRMKKQREIEKQKWDWTELVLPRLSPQTLASLSSSCRSLRALTRAITARRVADVTRGLEKFPVPISNSVDNCLYPYFLYATTSTLPSSFPHTQQWGHESSQTLSETEPRPRRLVGGDILRTCVLEDAGCICVDCSKPDTARVGNRKDDELVRNIVIEEVDDVIEGACPCGDGDIKGHVNAGGFSLSGGTRDRGNAFEGYNGGSLLVTECGPACRCNLSCRNRVSQRGLGVRVAVVRHPLKGWCLHSSQLIPAGTFVCEYAGELLTTAEARERQQKYDAAILEKCNFCSALLVIREHLPSGKACMRLNIDATKIGNVARFINHSCDGGNLLPILVRPSGSVLPRLCFSASRDISEGEELTFSYGIVGENSKPLSCFCGTAACCGMLPSEPT